MSIAQRITQHRNKIVELGKQIVELESFPALFRHTSLPLEVRFADYTVGTVTFVDTTWRQPHGCDDCGGALVGALGYYPAINPGCKTCGGAGLISGVERDLGEYSGDWINCYTNSEWTPVVPPTELDQEP